MTSLSASRSFKLDCSVHCPTVGSGMSSSIVCARHLISYYSYVLVDLRLLVCDDVYFRKWEPPFQTSLKRSSSSLNTKAAHSAKVLTYIPKYTASHTRKPES
jgi:hypothetical protein